MSFQAFAIAGVWAPWQYDDQLVGTRVGVVLIVLSRSRLSREWLCLRRRRDAVSKAKVGRAVAREVAILYALTHNE